MRWACCIDTGHLHFAGGDLLATLRRHGRRINHVHGKDIRADVLARLKAENWSFLKGVVEGVFTVPGDGAIDFAAVAKVLAEIGYEGWVVVEAEQDPEKANPLEMARIGHKALSRGVRRRGVRDQRLGGMLAAAGAIWFLAAVARAGGSRPGREPVR